MERALAVLAEKGLDLVVPFARSWADGDPPSNLPRLTVADPLCLLVGHGRRLWPAFLAAHRADEAPGPDPLDRWTLAVVRRSAATFDEPTEVRMSFDGGARLVPLQRVAHRIGFAHQGPAGLCVHPVHGPWFGMRAVIVVDRPGPSGPPPVARDPCTPCPAPCLAALAAAQAGGGWSRWADVRRVCPAGADEAYGEAQLRYHYTHDPSLLR